MTKTKLTKDQAQQLARLLQDTPDPTAEEVAQMARVILLDSQEDMEAAISEYLREKRQAATWMKQRAGRMFFSFLGPKPPETVVSESKDVVLVDKPVRPAYQVARTEFPAFCKEMGLNERKMEQVGMGEIPEYKDWRRADHFAYGQMSLGHEYQSPDKPAPIDRPAHGERVRVERFQYDPQPIVWKTDRTTD